MDRYYLRAGDTVGLSTDRAPIHPDLPHFAMLPFRYKKVIGRTLHARTLPTQKTEVACKVINIMTGLGMPVSRRVA